LPAINPYLLGDATFGALDKLEQNVNFRAGITLPNRLDRLRRVQVGLQQQAKCGFDSSDLFTRESFALQSDRVGTIGLRIAITHRLRVRKNVFGNDGVSTDISVSADATELMHAGIGANRRMVLNRYMAGERCRICHDDFAPQDAIVRHMCSNHEEIVIANPCVTSTAQRSAMDVDVLTKCVPFANRQKGLFAFVFEILWLDTNDAERKEAIVTVDRGWTFDNDVRIENASVPDRDVLADPAERSDTDAFPKACKRTDDGSRVRSGWIR